MAHQVCHCGWSKKTSYQGLRIHQGKMGCTPKGMRIPQNEQYRFNSSFNAQSFMKPRPWRDPWMDFAIHPIISARDVPRKTSEPVTSISAKETPLPAADTSLQVCHCGWSNMTTYQGLRIHQGKMGCTPNGMRIPQMHDVLQMPIRPVASTPVKQEKPVPAADTSLQVCHCGWSNMTTYQGLRIHQGKMGCTPKGMRIPQTHDVPQMPIRPVTSTPAKEEKPVPAADTSLQVCHCGWSNMTTYQGLRIHQGKMGCTPKGMRIPQMHDVPQKPIRPVTSTPAKEEKPVPAADTSLQVCHCGWTKMTTYQGLRIHQGKMGCTPKGIGTPPSQTSDVFETPPRSLKPINNARRELRFSTGAEQVQQLFQGLPMATAQDQAVQPKEKTREKVKDAPKPANVQQERIKADLRWKIQMKEQKMTEVRSVVNACEVSLDSEWLEINSVFSEVMKVVDNVRQKALQPLEERRDTLKTEAAVAIQKLQNDSDNLKTIIDQLDREPDAEVSLPEALDDSQDWQNVTAHGAVSLGTLRSLTSNMMENILQTLNKLSVVELKRISSFAVDVKLDPATAHQSILRSADGKTVSGTEEDHDVSERSNTLGSVLGLNRFSSGKSYWEVEVGNKTGWELGVARHDAKREGKVSLSPDYGYWVIIHSNEYYTAPSTPVVFLALTVKPQKVGVFVDYNEGLVSFYDVTSQSHIYSFTGCLFHGEIVPYYYSPYYSPCTYDITL